MLTGRWSRSRVVADPRATSRDRDRDRDENRERGPSPLSSAWPRLGVGVGLPAAPRAERVRRRAVFRYGCVVIADTDDLVRGLETSHPPMYYLPRQAFGNHLVPVSVPRSANGRAWARYVDVVVAGAFPLREVGWWYPRPDPRYPSLIDRVGSVRAVTLDGERVVAQPGGFLRRMDHWACCRAVQGRTWLLGLVRAGVRRVRHHGGMLPLSMRKELARNTADIEHSEGDRHWSAACATFWHPTRCLSCFAVLRGAARPRRSWRRAGDGEVRDDDPAKFDGHVVIGRLGLRGVPACGVPELGHGC